MSALPRYLTVVVLAAGSSLAFAQASAQAPPQGRGMQPDINALPRPAVPTDPLELVTGSAQSIETAEQRLAAVALLNKARDLSNVRAQPYDLKTSFTATGGSAFDGNWTLEDTSPSKGTYRWTAQGPGYSVINLYNDTTRGILYSSQPAGNIPLRLEQVREAIFFTYQMPGPQASVRTATGYLNGAQQNCVLAAYGYRGPPITGARGWDESEYCMDAGTGLLTTYSPVPGLYIHYDYSSAPHFHSHTIPDAFTITEGGRTVVDARPLSVADPPDPTNPMFDSSGLVSLGVGREMTPAARVRAAGSLFGGAHPAGANPAMQVIVLHGNAGPDGKVSEVGILASSDPAFNQAALDRVANWSNSPVGGRSQPGATAQSNEVFYTLEFLTYQ